MNYQVQINCRERRRSIANEIRAKNNVGNKARQPHVSAMMYEPQIANVGTAPVTVGSKCFFSLGPNDLL